MPRILLLEEPELFFGKNSCCIDPQVGLLNFGPHSGIDAKINRRLTINAGIIGTDRSIDLTNQWLNRLRHRIVAEETPSTEYKGIDFPGLSLDGPLGFEIVIDNNCVVRIDRRFVKEMASEELSRKDRILRLVREYCQKLDVISNADPLPKVVLMPIDEDVLRLCKESGRRTDKIVYQGRDFGDPDSSGAELFDFHNHIKAQAAKRRLVTQILSPKTMKFAEDKQSPALIGWNISVGIYYKATGTPWKLAEIDDNTCYIGISFFHEIGKDKKSIRASIAQVYMRTGESQVIRGEPFEWGMDKKEKTPHLNTDQMGKIVSDSIKLYEDTRAVKPRRVVVHKSSKFYDEELAGCEQACQGIDQLDIVQIKEFVSFRAYHEKNKFPVVRGTVITDDKEAMLFTTGFIPALGTYPGPTVPRPLHVVGQRIDTSIEMICNDIMGLTKLDWNSSTFCRRTPVTIGVSRKVGSVMAEIVSEGSPPPSSYRYYM